MNHALMNRAFARAVSIFGHPMVVLPLAAVALTLTRGQYRVAVWMGLGFAAFAGMVMAYSGWQVRRGRWSHVDASDRSERKSLNRFLLTALLVSTALAFWLDLSTELTLGLALSATMVAIAMLTSRWCKLSLHMAFVVFAAFLLLVNAPWWVGFAGLCFAAAVAWSRLALQRHVPRDLIAGALTGALAGVAFAMAVAAGTA
jgi:membrane-associated phospholipid phosphatase